jgi:peptidoglycan/xylan/chitin deacetylase (PgdA/CDA1 family)
MISIFFRYDDYSSISPVLVDQGLVEILQRKEIKATFAVIPAVTTGEYHQPGNREELLLSGEKLDLLTKAVCSGAVDLALHGWNHRTRDNALPPEPSEFAGLPLKDQVCRIKRGYDFLEKKTGFAPGIFVPPWNTYDANTILALEQVGIAGISANRYAPMHNSSAVAFLPATIEVKSLRRAILYARATNDTAPIIGVMLHPYDFFEAEDPRSFMGLADFEMEIEWLKQNQDVAIQSAIGLLNSDATLDSKRFEQNMPSVIENIYPPFLERCYQNPVYLSTKVAGGKRWKKTIAAIACHFCAMLLSFISIFFFLNMIYGYSIVVVQAGIILTATGIITLIFRALWNKGIYFKAMLLLFFLIGSNLAIMLHLVQKT